MVGLCYRRRVFLHTQLQLLKRTALHSPKQYSQKRRKANTDGYRLSPAQIPRVYVCILHNFIYCTCLTFTHKTWQSRGAGKEDRQPAEYDIHTQPRQQQNIFPTVSLVSHCKALVSHCKALLCQQIPTYTQFY